jgi:anti-sigma factor RsiW
VAEDRFEELLGPYLLGELTVEEERELERHLEACSECRHECGSLELPPETSPGSTPPG